MDWQEILMILVPLFGLIGWVYNRIEKKADERYGSLEKRIEKIENKVDQRFSQVDQQLQHLDRGLTLLQGHFDERGILGIS